MTDTPATEPTDAELARCPCTDRPQIRDAEPNGYQARCSSCDRRGPVSFSARSAIIAWNQDRAASRLERSMGAGEWSGKYEVYERKTEPGVWAVETFDKDGGCYLAKFYNPQAEERAEQYAALMRAALRERQT